MKDSATIRQTERGSAAVKFLIIFVVLAAVAHAGINYIPIAYNGASFRQEMDTAIVKGLSASGRLIPMDVVKAHLQKAAADNQIPADAVIAVEQQNGHVIATASYEQNVNILPFGIYRYKYKFDYTATPQGYLLKDK